MKITGKEWKEFEEHGWPEGYMWDDDPRLDNGTEIYNMDGILIFSDHESFIIPERWSISYYGPGGKQIDNGDGFFIRSLIRKWRKSLNTVTFAITVPIDKVDRIKEMLKAEKVQIT